MDAVAKITAARVQALSRWPYAASILFAFKLVKVDQGLETIGVDKGLRLYYNEEFIGKVNVQELATVLLHEVLHVVHSHHERFRMLKDPSPKHGIWNIAGDLGINHVLMEAGMSFPDAVQPVTYASYSSKLGLDPQKPTEDAYYKLLAELGGKDEGDGQPKAGDRDDSDDAEPNSGDEPVGNCGSIAGGSKQPYELDDDDEDSPAASDAEVDVVLDDFATAAVAHAKEHGDLPGGLARAVDDYLDPKVDWRRLLSALVRREVASIAGRKDYSFRRPSRRQDALRGSRTEVILPSMRQQPPPNIAVVYDTSGSMTQEALTRGMSEILGITRALSGRASLIAIPCDTKVHGVFTIKTSADLAKIKPLGGGGTDMPEGIAFAAKQKPQPKIIVVITDGGTDWPKASPRGVTQVIALLTENTSKDLVPKWIPVVLLDD